MGTRIALLLGRTIWTRDDRGWNHETVPDGPVSGARAVERLAEVLSAASGGTTVVVFEPEGMAHTPVEAPRVNRRVFASLERVRSEHPVVLSENLGWGMEVPEPGAGGEFVTQLHCEMTPGLLHVRDACEGAGSRLVAAWSAATAAEASVGTKPARKAAHVLILTRGFCAIAGIGTGKRSFRSWVGAMSERDWKAFAVPASSAEERPLPSMADGELRRGSIVVVADGKPESVCPVWDDLRKSGRVEAVVDLETFGCCASRIPTRHPANLVEAFPRPLELDRPLGVAAGFAFLCAAALGASLLVAGRQAAALGEAAQARVATLRDRVGGLEANRREMDRLRAQMPEAPPRAAATHVALAALASAIPDPLTLTSLSMARDGGFELEAMVVGPGFSPDDTRQALARSGFNPGQGGWTLDAASGALVVRGAYGEARP